MPLNGWQKILRIQSINNRFDGFFLIRHCCSYLNNGSCGLIRLPCKKARIVFFASHGSTISKNAQRPNRSNFFIGLLARLSAFLCESTGVESFGVAGFFFGGISIPSKFLYNKCASGQIPMVKSVSIAHPVSRKVVLVTACPLPLKDKG
jgi:hypothetical protein